MMKDNIVLSFHGRVSKEVLNSSLSILENHLESSESSKSVKKKFYYIVVEALQNLYHHIEEGEGSKALFSIGYDENENLLLITGNKIEKKKALELKSSIDELKGLSEEELRSLYQKKLESSSLSDKGGAGLGLIEIARKSKNGMDCSFQDIDGQNVFFSMNVKVEKQ